MRTISPRFSDSLAENRAGLTAASSPDHQVVDAHAERTCDGAPLNGGEVVTRASPFVAVYLADRRAAGEDVTMSDGEYDDPNTLEAART